MGRTSESDTSDRRLTKQSSDRWERFWAQRIYGNEQEVKEAMEAEYAELEKKHGDNFDVIAESVKARLILQYKHVAEKLGMTVNLERRRLVSNFSSLPEDPVVFVSCPLVLPVSYLAYRCFRAFQARKTKDSPKQSEPRVS